MRVRPAVLGVFSVFVVFFTLHRPAIAAPTRPRAKPTPEVAEPTEDDKRAKKLFEDGTRTFNLGEFQASVDLYRQAYKLKPEPGLLYNIAQAYRLANDLQNAVFFYRSFLRGAPQTPNRKEVEERIRKLEGQINDQKAPPNAAVPPGALPPPEADGETKTPTKVEPTTAETPAVDLNVKATPDTSETKTPIYKKWWLWTGVGIVVVLGVGLGVGLGIGLQQSTPSTHFGSRPVF